MVLIVFLLGAAVIFGQNQQAVIREMTGTVEMKRNGSADWIPAKVGDRVETATIVSTGFKSTAILDVGSSTLMVRPLTRLSLEALLLDQDNVETINIGLRAGRIQVNVTPPPGSRTNYTVQTPVATASVRGTVFSVDPVSIRVIEGVVKYEATGQTAAKSFVVNGVMRFFKTVPFMTPRASQSTERNT